MVYEFFNWLLSGQEFISNFPVATDLLAVVIDSGVIVLLTWRLWRYPPVGSMWVNRIAMGILCMAELYQVAACCARLSGTTLGYDFRGSWILKDIGLALYIYTTAYLNWKIGGFNKKTERLTYFAADHKHDQRFHIVSESPDSSEKP